MTRVHVFNHVAFRVLNVVGYVTIGTHSCFQLQRYVQREPCAMMSLNGHALHFVVFVQFYSCVLPWYWFRECVDS